MTLSVLAAFWAVSFLFIITPGADWAYAISAGMRGRLVTPAVAGLLSGHLLATVVVAAGVGGLVASNPMILRVMTLAGSGYLLWLGVSMIRHPSTPESGAVQVADSGLRWAWKGLCVSGLNPKVFLLFLALLPQFTDPLSVWPIPAQIAALGALHAFSCGVVYLMVGFGAKAVLQTRPSAAQNVSRISGAIMIVIAVVLLAGQILHQ
ncbi:LysE family translocator [Pseudomonas sp. 7P_10.2_Bac1]|uniref:LysE family translocator n=1 Tax=Pseudomonas sp. 7P_10.2_Bac1 TaxID=2971614 RepID=UPI0021C9923A|nr:LysE family translocator [Pseudomonas sp. 7P_10.2_Bac1]MCU1725885.1 LysE family translocator [Pseudomonas sp. 7P_10.2_Bac1]